MKLYVEATLKDVSKEGFDNQETGEKVEYYVNTLKNAEGEKLECNSKDDKFSKLEGKYGVATILARAREKGGFKLSLVDFKEGIELDKGETETVLD